MAQAGLIARVRAALPAGDPLPEATWVKRHRAILAILWIHVPALLAVGIATQHGVRHSSLEALAIAVLALGASFSRLGRTLRASLTTVGLITCSAMLVHFSGGLIEMHFHFFVMVAVVTLYQAWTPFLIAIGYVVLHHGTAGVMDPMSVYNHPSAIANPWKWALVHGFFVAGASAAGLTAWKLNEIGMQAERDARKAFEYANAELAEAQTIAEIGSWDWDLVDNHVWWSDQLYRIIGADPVSYEPTLNGFFDLLHPDDVERVRREVERGSSLGASFAYEARLRRPDGTYRTALCLGKAVTDELGRPIKMNGTVQDLTERKTLEEKVEHQAFHDSLTDLANRALFLDRVEHALGRQSRTKTAAAVLFFDLDDFKSVNDSLGHGVGDELLVQVGERIASLV